MNEFNDKTAVRTRRTPFRPAADGGADADTEQSLNVLPVGTHLGEFEILDLIGEGGFGIVYLAYDHSLERHVALKEYMPSGLATRTTGMAVTVRSRRDADTFSTGLKSFINEARMLAQFDSPSLVKVHRFWEGNGTAYMVMPFYEGITLKQALKEQRIAPTEAWIRLLLGDLFDAIETIHGAHCLHRDIAPDNILLLKDGRPLLLDFGAARRVIGDLTQRLTVILKPGFAPIEQYANSAGLRQGAWTDLYALAGVVYYLISGKAPPPAVARIVHDDMLPAREAGKGRYGSAFLAAIDKALAVKPEQRFRSVAEMRRALGIMDTMPRTLPQSQPEWATTVARTAPPAQPAAMPPPRRAHERREPDMRTEYPTQFDTAWQKPAAAARPAHGPPQRGRPAWLALMLLLFAGIAAGVYWGMQRPWEISTQAPSVAAPAQDSSGGDAPEQDSQAQATAPAQGTPPAPDVAETAPQAEIPADSGDMQAAAPQQAEPSVPRAPSELELWRIAGESGEASAYEDYLRQYPDGRYATLAKLRLERMQPPTAAIEPPAEAAPPAASSAAAPSRSAAKAARAPGQPASAAGLPATQSPPQAAAKAPSAAQASGAGASGASGSGASGGAETPESSTRFDDELALWDAAKAINEAPAYESYLSRYPDGRFAPLARDRLAGMKPAEPEAPAPQAAEEAPAAAAAASSQPAQPPEAPQPMEQLASIKPSEPVVPPETRPSAETPPAGPPPPAGDKRTIKLDDQTMIGDFTVDPKTGIVSGTGKIIWNNGNQFEGTLVRGVKQGKGKFVWSNGQRYSGDWARDMPNGKGTIVFANGNRYEGDVKDGMPHGQGTTRFKDGDVYTGAWVGGKSHGHGRYTWANGSYWEGEFRNDRRTENGTLVFSEEALREARNAAAGAQDPERAAAGPSGQ